MHRLTELTNISKGSVRVKMSNGSEYVLPPATTIKNITITNYDDIVGQVKVKENLTEVGEHGRKKRLDG